MSIFISPQLVSRLGGVSDYRFSRVQRTSQSSIIFLLIFTAVNLAVNNAKPTKRPFLCSPNPSNPAQNAALTAVSIASEHSYGPNVFIMPGVLSLLPQIPNGPPFIPLFQLHLLFARTSPKTHHAEE